MKMTYDKESDVLYVQIEEHPAKDCQYIEPDEGIVYRISPSGRVVGITILGFSSRAQEHNGIDMPFALPQPGLRLAEA